MKRAIFLLSSHVLLSGLLLAASAPQPIRLPGEIPSISVGDKQVRGKLIKPHDAQWASDGLGPDLLISESTRIERIDGKKLIVREQVWPIQPGIDLHARLVLDSVTLQTISFQRKVVGLPAGAEIGGPLFARWEFDGAEYTRTAGDDEGEAVVEKGKLEHPMFDGNGLGLVIAALPLKEGYEARLPVVMTTSLAVDLTLYWVDVRVVGKETFAGPRKDVEAWIVNVDWLDYDSGELTSKGGADEAGGAYFVVPKPPKGYPHVPRYANSGGVIEVVAVE